MINPISKIYTAIVLQRPIITLLLMAVILSVFAGYVKDFRLDASTDSLLLDDDKGLKLFREVAERYATREFLFVTFEPKRDLFTSESIEVVKQLRDKILALAQVESVTSMIDVPLMRQTEGTLSEVAENVRTIEHGDVDLQKARQELLTSPIYRQLILSKDGTTTALQVYLTDSPEFHDLQQQRDALLYKKNVDGLTAAERQQLDDISALYVEQKKEIGRLNHESIESIRAIIDNYRSYGTLYLGGTPMIVDDMITFIKHDLVVFGVGVFLFLVGMLAIIFRQLRWVILPLISCFYAGLLMLGLLGMTGWNVTVISSNFISLMLIITMSMNIHLIVRYRQLQNDHPDSSQYELVLKTTSKMVWPCLYTALTTVIAFSSLVISGIKPVIDFGWMMTIGLIVSFLTSFVLFPAILILLPKLAGPTSVRHEFRFAPKLAAFTERHGKKVILTTAVLAVISLFGITRLEVENSFINYFSADTEIFKGLRLIDKKLGGTIPLDIILKLEDEGSGIGQEGSFDELDNLFSSFDEGQEGSWYTPERIDRVKQVHDYLDSLPAVGKVLSLASVIRVGEQINKGPLDAFELAVVSKRMPAELREMMIKPYVAEERNEARINIRVLDSLKDLRRKELLEQIEREVKGRFQFSDEEVRISGILVLYNNMLQSLFKSQILTMGVVMAGIALMLLLLFRSVTLALIGITPNILAAAIILGLMGLLRITLDMMTITVAAITIGIAVDNSIHYIYRFREEFPKTKDYTRTMYYCHANIGKAVFYTAITIIIGFSILILSNFIPSIYFGLLTALAMAIALLASLTLLPKLILVFKPFS